MYYIEFLSATINNGCNNDCEIVFGLLGGAISNMYSIMAARYQYFPDVKSKGMTAVPKLVLFTSENVR